jgi:hypothetical protein
MSPTASARSLTRSFTACTTLAIAALNGLPAALPVTAAASERPPHFLSSPAVAIAQDADQVRITFAGILEAAADIHGPWLEVAGAVSPILVDPAGAGPRFYRSREAAGDGVFSSRAVVDWILTGPFQSHFELAFAGLPDGIFPPHREKPYFEGTLQMGGFEVPVAFRVRGNSSLQECPFPKLKVKIGREERAGTPFADAREIKIGTHCAEGGRGTVGRLRDERATFREALAYEMLHAAGFVAPRVRRARIEYRDTTTSAGPGEPAVEWQVVRNAVILDHVEVVGERIGARALSDEEVASLTDARFDEQLIADLQLFHALIGNWDYVLSPTGEGLWNVEVIELPDGTLVPLAGDFDLCSLVTGEVRLSAPHDYRPDLPDVERQAHYEIQQIRGRVAASVFAAGRTRFAQKRALIEEQIQTAAMDEPGRTNAVRHVTAFFEALAGR